MRRLTWIVIALLASAGCKKKKTEPSETPEGSAGSATAPTARGLKASLAGARGTNEAFTPSTQGFKFQNYGNEGGIQNLTAAELKRMFGAQVCAADEEGECTLTPAAEQWMETMNDGMDGGHCEGMATLALLFRVGKLSPKDFGGASAYELPLAGNDKLQREIAYWFATQGVSPMSEAEVRTLSPNQVVDKLVESFKKGDESWTIGIYMRDGTLGHATTPYAIVEKSDTETWIMHYDNNFPGEERHIDVDRTANTWKYFTASDPKEPGSVYEGDAETHTLTIAPTSVRTGKLDCPFCGDIDTEGAEAPKGMRQITLDGDADLLIIDDAGKRIGYAGGKLVNEIPGAHAVQVKSANGLADHEPYYYIPSGRKLTATIDGSKLTKEDQTDVSLVAPGYTMGVYGIELDPGAKDQIVFSADWKEITYTTQQDATPDLEIGIETKDADYEFDINASSEGGGNRIDVQLDPKAGTLVVVATAKDGTSTYEIEIRKLDEDGTVHVFKHDGVSAGPKDRFVFHYGTWKGNGQTLDTDVDRDGDGDIDDNEDYTDEE